MYICLAEPIKKYVPLSNALSINQKTSIANKVLSEKHTSWLVITSYQTQASGIIVLADMHTI